MPIFSYATILRCPPAKVFDFLARPANAVKVTPPEMHAKLLEGPERLVLGSRIRVQVSKFAISQTITSEVKQFEEGVSFTDCQVAGPFQKFDHNHLVESLPDGTVRMTDTIDYEAPRGLIGFYLTNDRMRSELEATFRYREGKFRELLDQS